MAGKIVQITSVKAGEGNYGAIVIALDDRGQLWSTFTLHAAKATNWQKWQPLPELPEDPPIEFGEPIIG